MKKAEVHVGGVYVAKISGKLTTVQIDRESPYGGWSATNTQTKREVRIRTAAKLRGEPKPPLCGRCANCLERKQQRPVFRQRYVEAKTVSLTNAVAVQDAWTEFLKQHPCLEVAG